jgi:4'-phosphopantetheinyl transferase
VNDIIPSLFFCKTTDISINIDILNILPIERQHRIKQALKQEKSVQLYASSLLLGHVLNRYGKKLNDVKVTELGKPYVENSLHFNISHSGKCIVIAVDYEDIGVDIQEKTPVSNAVAKLFLGNDDDLSSMSRNEYYHSYIWCRKEALLKCLGVGWNGKKEVKLSVLRSRIQYEGIEYFLTDYPISEDYFLTLCEKNNHKDFVVEEVSKHELEFFYRSD